VRLFSPELSTNHISGEFSTLWFSRRSFHSERFFLAQEGLPAEITFQHLGVRDSARLSPGPGQLCHPGGLRHQGKLPSSRRSPALYRW